MWGWERGTGGKAGCGVRAQEEGRWVVRVKKVSGLGKNCPWEDRERGKSGEDRSVGHSGTEDDGNVREWEAEVPPLKVSGWFGGGGRMGGTVVQVDEGLGRELMKIKSLILVPKSDGESPTECLVIALPNGATS